MKMKIRWKLLLLLLAIALVPLVAAGALDKLLTRRMGARLAGQRREILTAKARGRLQLLVDDYGRILQRDRRLLEMALRVQAREVERRLARPVPARPELFFATDYDAGRRPPPGLAPSEMHFRLGPDGKLAPLPVTYAQQVCLLAPGVDRASKGVAADLARLSTLPAAYRRLHDDLPGMTYWQYTSLASGVHTCYPGHGGYPATYEPRERPWYRRAKDTGELTWLAPIRDASTRVVTLTLSMPVRRPDGSFAGVTAIDVPFSAIFRELKLPQDWAAMAETVFVVPARAPTQPGRGLLILAHRGDQARRRDWTTPVELELLTSPDAEELAALAADAASGRSGVRELRHRGSPALWAYGAGKGRDAFPVVIVPTARVLAQALQAERYVQDTVVRGLELSGLVLLAAVAAVAVVAFVSSRYVTRPIRELTAAARRLAAGDYEARVDVRTGDELQELGEVFNDTGPKLAERQRMKQALELAMGIQQHLLPEAPPELEGFDISGRCDYCDETGGDYYDFISLVDVAPGRVGIAVGDVTGHGIAAALLMASARGVLRSHAAAHGDLGELFAHVNRHLVRDTGEERFMTLFYGVLDGPGRTLSWISGGHDPAIWLRRTGGRFEELPNTGVPLGILEEAPYASAGPVRLEPGDVVLIGTDGIWEATNAAGEQFGKDRLRQVMAANAERTAAEIHSAVVEAVAAFRGTEPQKDDVTLVVIKGV